MKNIRNFCIIAHIDHGKSTLADRLLEKTNTLNQREMQAQVLDDMDLEREKGITIKSHAIQMEYKARDGQLYTLNLIDTPGHVDFSYEVSRAIASCEGALLVVDATQGIQAQTISNLYLAVGHDLEIIPVLNKIDMDSAMIDEVKDQVIDLIGCKDEDILLASGKTGLGVEEVLEAIVQRIPAPEGDENAPLQALIFDSVFNPFRGIIAYYRVFNGRIRKGEHVKFFNTGSQYDADEVGVLKLKMQPRDEIKAGDVGYICSGIKTSSDVKVGDTITTVTNPAREAIAGFEDVKPMVFAGVYPVEADQYEDLRASLEKLQLNDASLTFEPESSLALGFGFRCGFLGLLHMEIIQERLYREFDMDVITTVPNVSYRITTTQGDVVEVHNPSGLPEVTKIAKIEEPYILAQIITKSEFLGNVIKLCIDKRGVMKNQTFITQDRVEINFDMPLSEIVFDFYDKLKSISKGYASFDYHRTGYQPSKLVKLDILLNGEPVDALSSLLLVMAVLSIDDQLLLVQEFVGDQNRLIEIAARIAPEVEDQFGDAFRPQRSQRLLHLRGGGAGELPQFDVTDAVGDAECRFDALDRNLVAYDIDADQLADSLPSESEVHCRAARTAQFLHHVALRNLLSRHERVVDLDDAVAGLDSGLVARSLRDDVQHDHRVGGHVEDHADAVELALQRFVQLLHLGSRNVDRMRIQLLDQQRYDMFGQRIHRHRIDILVLDQRERVSQFVGRQGHLPEHAFDLRSGAVAAHVLSQQQAQYDARCQQQREEDGVFRIFVHCRSPAARHAAVGL